MRIALIVFLLLSFPGIVQAKECSPDDALAAEKAVDSLSSWPTVLLAYQRYGHCDQGPIAESFTDKIVHLLATRWDDYHKFKASMGYEPGFGDFIARHVNSSADADDLKRVVFLAESACPPNVKLGCLQIARAANAR